MPRKAMIALALVIALLCAAQPASAFQYATPPEPPAGAAQSITSLYTAIQNAATLTVDASGTRHYKSWFGGLMYQDDGKLLLMVTDNSVADIQPFIAQKNLTVKRCTYSLHELQSVAEQIQTIGMTGSIYGFARAAIDVAANRVEVGGYLTTTERMTLVLARYGVNMSNVSVRILNENFPSKTNPGWVNGVSKAGVIVYIRPGPASGSNELEKMTAGVEIPVMFELDGDWLQVMIDSEIVYMHKGDVKLPDGAKVPRVSSVAEEGTLGVARLTRATYTYISPDYASTKLWAYKKDAYVLVEGLLGEWIMAKGIGGNIYIPMSNVTLLSRPVLPAATATDLPEDAA